MLDQFPVHASLAASDIERAKQWYEQKLGLKPKQEMDGGAWYECGDGTWFLLYASGSAGTAQNTVAGWTVKDIESVMDELRGRGVTFEEYDMPGLKTKNGLMVSGPYKAAWAKDSEGNILELSEVSEAS
jgi:catechol 2,3-dioxygenase-like lactoylglutathione lyase family enzyme